jgi:alginate O-acetyltransferase complex protein AlgI
LAPNAARGPWSNLVLVALGYAFVLILPNTQQIMGRYTPALDWPKWRHVALADVTIQFRPTPTLAIGMGLVLSFGIVFIMRGQSEFIYFRF